MSLKERMKRNPATAQFIRTGTGEREDVLLLRKLVLPLPFPLGPSP
jgi:hypothetical protein